MNEFQIREVKRVIEEILRLLTAKGLVEVLENADGTHFVIRTDEAGILIGENGQNLDAFSHIVKKVAHQKFSAGESDATAYFSVDVNDYLAKKIEDLKVLAKMNAQKAIYFKKPIEMEPMSAHERRVIHSILTDHPNITTESVGVGYARRVVIKPLE